MVLREVHVVWEGVITEQMQEVAERGQGVAGQAIEQVTEEMAD